MSKCMRPGPITSNGYLNFLREFRKKCCGLTAIQTVKVGAKAWNKLTCKEKAKYRLMGCKMGRSKRPKKKSGGCRKSRPKRPKRQRGGCKKRSKRPKRKRGGCKKRPKKRRPKSRRGGCGARRRPRPRPRRKSGGCRKSKGKGKGKGRGGKNRKRCMKAGPVTANAYLNFLRLYRRKHCGMKPQEAVKKGARKWCSLKPECRRRFQRQACMMSKSQRRKRTAICRSFKSKSKRSRSKKRRC